MANNSMSTEQNFGIRNSIALFDLFAQKSQKGIWNSELLLMELPWRFREQKLGIGISMYRSLGPKNVKFF